MKLERRRIFAAIATAALSATLVATPGPAMGQTSCASDALYGASGSGEIGLGSQLTATAAAYRAALGRYVYVQSIEYPRPHIDPRNIIFAGDRAQIGANNLVGTLNWLSVHCPGQRYALAGNSLGSWVIQLALNHPGLTPAARQRIKGVVLFGSPKFDSSDPFARGGTSGRGIANAMRVNARRGLTYCNQGDMVCQYNAVNVWNCIVRKRCNHTYGAVAVQAGNELATMTRASSNQQQML